MLPAKIIDYMIVYAQNNGLIFCKDIKTRRWLCITSRSNPKKSTTCECKVIDDDRYRLLSDQLPGIDCEPSSPLYDVLETTDLEEIEALRTIPEAEPNYRNLRDAYVLRFGWRV